MSTFSSTGSWPAVGDTGVIDIPGAIHLNGHASLNGAHFMREAPAPAGHNSSKAPEHSFQDNADELIRVGRLITSFRRIGHAIRDRRCERSHLLVLYAIMEKLNEKTGTAFPSRRAISEQEALGEKVVENAVYELRLWGYIDWERRAEPELHRGRLLHYTLPVLTWTDEELTTAILAHRETLKTRNTPSTGYPAHGGQRPRGTPPTGSESTPPTGTRNLLKEPANTLSGADAPGASATDLFARRAQTSAKGAGCKPLAPPDVDDESAVNVSPAAREALDAFNAAAAVDNFTPCNFPTDTQAGRLEKRIKGIGGIRRFKRALGALPLDDFLMGRVKPKDGGKPFRLNLDRLLRTDGPMGDVLGRLLELADEAGAATPGTPADPDAALKHLVASPFGQRTLERYGQHEGMKILRARIAASGSSSNA